MPKDETEGRSHRCSYATPYEVITSYRLPDKGCFAFISQSVMIVCKVRTFLFGMAPFQPLILSACDYCNVTLLNCSTNKSKHITTMDGVRGETERGEIDENGH